MTTNKGHVAILGGGPCGLYAGRILSKNGFQVTIIDKGERPGGLATSNLRGANWFDMGVHMLHGHDEEILHDIKALMGEDSIEVELNARIRWADGYFRYPLQFQDMIKGIPFIKLCKQVAALLAAQLRYSIFPKTPLNAEEALIQLYGKPLYRFFFENFTHRYWGIHPKQIDAAFIKSKMPKLTAVDVLKKMLSSIGFKQKITSDNSALAEETLNYSKTGAEAMTRHIANSIINNGGNVILNAEVTQVITKQNRITDIIYKKENKTQQIQCDYCISTIPITTLAKAITPSAEAEISTAADKLRYKAIAVYGLLVKKQKCLEGLYIYYRNRIFHRVGEPKNAGLVVNPPDHSVLIVEMTCEPGDKKWQGDASVLEQVYKDLAAEGICHQQDIVETYINTYTHGYPIYDLGFETHLNKITNFLNGFTNLKIAGRQAEFNYPNMHGAMRRGYTEAQNIMELCNA